jgi:hypothetical protein
MLPPPQQNRPSTPPASATTTVTHPMEKPLHKMKIMRLTAYVLWTVVTVHLKTSFVVLWYLANFLSVHVV